jgi:DNA polymerase III subunit delta
LAPASPLKPLIVLHGDSDVLKRRMIGRLVTEHLQGEDPAFAVQQFWAREAKPEEMAAAIGEFSLLASDRVVVLYELQSLSAAQQKILLPSLSQIPPGTLVVITTSPPAEKRLQEPNLSVALKNRVKEVGESRILFNPRERELQPWVVEEAGRYGKKLDSAAGRLLIETVGADCDRLVNEIAKLAAYVGAAPSIDVEAVRQCASVSDDRGVFDLVDAIGRKQVADALSILKALLPRNAGAGAAIPLLGMIARHLRMLWQAVYVIGNGGSLSGSVPEELAARLPDNQNVLGQIKGMRFLADKYSAQAKNFSEGQLARALLKVYEADLALKGQGNAQMDDRMIVELLVVSLCES